MRLLGFCFLVLGVMAVIAAAISRTQGWEGARMINAVVPLLGGLGAVLLLLDRRKRKR